jgi:hypothetical protein
MRRDENSASGISTRLLWLIAGWAVWGVVGVDAAWAQGQMATVRKPPLDWKVLLIIKPTTALPLKDQAPIKTAIPKENIADIRNVFMNVAPKWIEQLSEGRLRWRPKVVLAPAPLDSATEMSGNNWWLAPWNLQHDVKKLVPLGEYDSVFVYWRVDEEGKYRIGPGFGWSIGPTHQANHCGWTCIHYAGGKFWTKEGAADIFVHEWLHQLEAFYAAKGVDLPKGWLHINSSYGYTNDPKFGWKPLYKDYMNRNILEPDGRRTGLGEMAWALGTIRDESRISTPEYLTAAVKKSNLLKDGSFEEDGTPQWTTWTFLMKPEVATVVDKGARHGQRAVLFQATEADDVLFKQTVPVKPQTRYLVSGWTKTENVVIAEKDATAGANLSLFGTSERSSPKIVGTNGWTYLSFTFDSGNRETVEVAARLGNSASTSTGTVWFDDLTMVELPKRTVEKK